MVDVKTRRCEHYDCGAFNPNYGLPGHQATRCHTHRKEGDILGPRSKCKHPDCGGDLAIYGVIGKKPEACERHKVDDMHNLVERKCKSCGLPEVLDHNDRCNACDPVTFRRMRLRKQKAVSDFLKARDFKFVEDRQLEDAAVCNLRTRPDFRFPSCPMHNLMGELDEHQHYDRDRNCEQIRMVNLSQASGLPSVFIRLNPDRYKPAWGNEVPLNKRYEEFERVLRHWLNTVPEFPENSSCGVVYLYYDGDTPAMHNKMHFLANDAVASTSLMTSMSGSDRS